MTPPPATISGRSALRMTSAAAASRLSSGTMRGIRQIRGSTNSAGNSHAWACTSWGSATVTAPVSAGLVSTRIAATAAGTSCSGRSIRSQYRDTGWKQSFTETSPRPGTSSCCRTGSGIRDANTSPGNNSTGRRLIVAPAAAVSMFVAPGPIDVVHANVASLFRMRAYPGIRSDVLHREPRRLVGQRADDFRVLRDELEHVRLQRLQVRLRPRDLRLRHVVRLLGPGRLAAQRHQVGRLILEDDLLLVSLVEQRVVRGRLSLEGLRVVVDRKARPPERIAHLVRPCLPEWDVQRHRVQ